jgi:hypothetical protein
MNKNIRLRGNQINTIVTQEQLSSAWDYFKFPKGKCPSISQIEIKDKDGEPWYYFDKLNNSYYYVSFTFKSAYPFDVTYNKVGRF